MTGGLVEVEAGIQWPVLISDPHELLQSDWYFWLRDSVALEEAA